jgi:broad specificity phosphatase PhoE
VEPHRQAALAAWCDLRLARIHHGRYRHLDDDRFWACWRDSLDQWAAEQARPYRPDEHTTRTMKDIRRRGVRPWEHARYAGDPLIVVLRQLAA